ncbi:MAG: AmmeMemoRadiSam system protein A [Anaerolineae bacterium]|jgi:AmmeMemoRadiSam system protein A|nr:AmmeMemoRadiSam system protein A [Anaerolineae bacterium]
MDTQPLTAEEKQTLLRLAREAIREALSDASMPEIALETLPLRLRENGAAFVTLTLDGQLRGCIGSLSAHRPLVLDVQRHAVDAAFDDPRFPPLTDLEFAPLRIEISVLSEPQPLLYADPDDLLRKLRPGIDGVILERGWNRGTFLPQVWEQLPEPEIFLSHLCQKAGLPTNAWKWPDIRISLYQVEKFMEEKP